LQLLPGGNLIFQTNIKNACNLLPIIWVYINKGWPKHNVHESVTIFFERGLTMKKFFTPRWLLVILFGLLIELPVIINAAQKAGPQHQCCITRWDMIKFINDLNLTEEQEQAIDNIKKQTETTLQPLKEQAQGLRSQMQETFLAAELDTAKADAQIQQMIQLAGHIEDIALHAKLQEAQILTPDQRALVLAKMKEVQECRQTHGTVPSVFPNLFR
jgi:Spy/CpxP family protein refolding chaperone